MFKTFKKNKIVAFLVFAISVFSLPLVTTVSHEGSQITQIALNYSKDSNVATGQSILHVMEFGLLVATEFGLLCGIQAVAVAVPLL